MMVRILSLHDRVAVMEVAVHLARPEAAKQRYDSCRADVEVGSSMAGMSS